MTEMDITYMQMTLMGIIRHISSGGANQVTGIVKDGRFSAVKLF